MRGNAIPYGRSKNRPCHCGRTIGGDNAWYPRKGSLRAKCWHCYHQRLPHIVPEPKEMITQ